MNAHDYVNVGESALVVYAPEALEDEDGAGITGPLTVNIHLAVDKLIIYRQGTDAEEADESTVYLADFIGFEEAEDADGFRARFENLERVGRTGASWFSFSGRSDTATFHVQPNP